jgi:hypothetical protein
MQQLLLASTCLHPLKFKCLPTQNNNQAAQVEGGNMPREFDEKRDSIRVSVDCPIRFRDPETATEEVGKVMNLSGRGMMFIAERELMLQTHLEVRIDTAIETGVPMHARARVVRVAKQRRGDGFEVGAIVEEMLDD